MKIPETRQKAAAIVELFKVLGDINRLKIVRLLASHPEKTYCVADLASALGITPPAVSQHIRALKQVGILEPEKVGFRVYYYINIETLKAHKAAIDEIFEVAFTPCPYLEMELKK